MKTIFGFALLIFATASFAWADSCRDSAVMFHNLFKQTLPMMVKTDPMAADLHFVPDDAIVQAEQAGSIEEAMELAKKTTVDSLVEANNRLPIGSPVYPIDEALKKVPLTMVIVPGIFGEFIRVRPFESILARHSTFRNQYESWATLARQKDLASGSDLSYSSGSLKEENVNLEKLVQAGSIDDENGQPVVKIIFFYPDYGSLETLGDATERAEMLNRRLEKYLAITGPQNLVFVGYSRGTTFALEMLSQAKKNNASWVKDVKGLIGLSGVVWGSTSADQTVNPKEPMSEIVSELHKFSDALIVTPPGANVLERTKALGKNGLALWAFVKFVKDLGNKQPKPFDFSKVSELAKDPLLGAALQIDFMSSTVFLVSAIGNLVIRNMDANNTLRIKNVINAALLGADQLRTEQRMDWWKSADLPENVTYYALTAIMPNPDDSEESKKLFDSKVAFAKGSFEDRFLLKGRNDYLKASGVSANDSQVAIPQAMFLPNVIHNVNPSLPPLKTQFLGTIGTHHWGAALEIVFDMKGKATNQFPREALMKALAAKVALDNQP